MPDCHPDSVTTAAWQARLRLGFRRDGGVTRLAQREHSGPLRVQKALYPEDPAICHAIVVHPPGGVVGGDRLAIDVHVGETAHAFLTTPGAAKWYRANGKVAHQQVTLDVAAGGSLEWLPQETILFNDAHVELDHHVTLAPDAAYLGCEILCLGRRAAGETFNTGRIGQRMSIRRGGRLLWWEQGALTPGLQESPVGMAGASVCATLLACGPQVPPDVLQAVRALADVPHFGATQMKYLLAVRWLGDDSEAARDIMLAAWRLLRPAVLAREPADPRSWRT
ncbi:urease accessory protein UreD [Pseudoduganella plicata]|uniref:Urease accessory protein UreD n=1 Tax=Pseudoduganella plicata TaxID=321984 RepID=A0A4P7B959_9BURK|nr:urease accessory protein UreD [Pseudoduganella plicata]QBQ34844.1 urease accessory protein UreD [Pseudoduganella plicata]GGY88982.1 urease accessory protein UreD [Pseudoduganella plicata]